MTSAKNSSRPAGSGRSRRPVAVLRAAGVGAVAGLAGGAVMSLGEKLEQAVTHRPDSHVPARALLALLGRDPGDAATPVLWNHVMHYGTAATLGALRGVWAVTGIRGAHADAWHTVVRLAFDQTVENVTGAGAPPATWPARELAVDVLHKTVFSVVTGQVADRLLPATLVSGRGRLSH
ncbi:hypothetical protein [Kineococcus sp. SYSU DK003]|uniref:hypothetical protein n=1 Tax=Kineococcus sp. SYSU DK003 TaxID=3383124 RepID=UPI003D7E9254